MATVNWPTQLPNYLRWIPHKTNMTIKAKVWADPRSRMLETTHRPSLVFTLTTCMHVCARRRSTHTQVWAHKSGSRLSWQGLICAERKAKLLLCHSTSGSKVRLRGPEQTNCCQSVSLNRLLLSQMHKIFLYVENKVKKKVSHHSLFSFYVSGYKRELFSSY